MFRFVVLKNVSPDSLLRRPSGREGAAFANLAFGPELTVITDRKDEMVLLLCFPISLTYSDLLLAIYISVYNAQDRLLFQRTDN